MKPKNKNFFKCFPLWKASGLDNPFRCPLHYIKFANGYAYATDAHIRVRARLTDISDFDEQELALLDGKCIHATNFKKIAQSKGEVTITGDAIEVKEENYSVNYPLLTRINFPNCEKAMETSDLKPLRKSFGINAELLSVLSEVMNCNNGVKMEWLSNEKLEVTPRGDHKNIKGIIMTMVEY